MRRSLVVLAVLGLAGQAWGGACPGPGLSVLPSGADPVPTNVAVRVIFAAETAVAVELVDAQSRQIAASGAVDAATATFAIHDGAGAVVASTTVRTPGTAHPGFVVTPAAPLAPSSSYAVVVEDSGKAYVVARFMTGAGPDDDAPALDSIGKATLYRWRPSSPPHWKDPHGLFAELTASATGAIGFEIHADAAATIDSLRTVIAAGGGPRLRFGALGSCDGPDFAFPKQRAPLKLWVRAFDAAGNVSPLRAITIDLRRPRAR